MSMDGVSVFYIRSQVRVLGMMGYSELYSTVNDTEVKGHGVKGHGMWAQNTPTGDSTDACIGSSQMLLRETF